MAKEEPFWQLDPNKDPKPHWIDFISPDGFYEANVTWDGCIHFTEYSTSRFDLEKLPEGAREDEHSRYLHICDLDDLISRLEALRDIAKQSFAKFDKEWPG